MFVNAGCACPCANRRGPEAVLQWLGWGCFSSDAAHSSCERLHSGWQRDCSECFGYLDFGVPSNGCFVLSSRIWVFLWLLVCKDVGDRCFCFSHHFSWGWHAGNEMLVILSGVQIYKCYELWLPIFLAIVFLAECDARLSSRESAFCKPSDCSSVCCFGRLSIDLWQCFSWNLATQASNKGWDGFWVKFVRGLHLLAGEILLYSHCCCRCRCCFEGMKLWIHGLFVKTVRKWEQVVYKIA